MRMKATISSLCLIAFLAIANVVYAEGDFFEDLNTALEYSGLDLESVIEITPVEQYNGKITYRFTEVDTGQFFEAQVEGAAQIEETEQVERTDQIEGVPFTPQKAVPGEYENSYSLATCYGSFYQHINYEGRRYRTNIDHNDLRTVGWNDTISSIVTSCSPVIIWEHLNWSGRGLYIAANQRLSDLRSYGFNDKFSSFYLYYKWR